MESWALLFVLLQDVPDVAADLGGLDVAVDPVREIFSGAEDQESPHIPCPFFADVGEVPETDALAFWRDRSAGQRFRHERLPDSAAVPEPGGGYAHAERRSIIVCALHARAGRGIIRCHCTGG